jgi:hypothetical protein
MLGFIIGVFIGAAAGGFAVFKFKDKIDAVIQRLRGVW